MLCKNLYLGGLFISQLQPKLLLYLEYILLRFRESTYGDQITLINTNIMLEEIFTKKKRLVELRKVTTARVKMLIGVAGRVIIMIGVAGRVIMLIGVAGRVIINSMLRPIESKKVGVHKLNYYINILQSLIYIYIYFATINM